MQFFVYLFFLLLGKTRLTIDKCIGMLNNSDIEDISDYELNDDDECVENTVLTVTMLLKKLILLI